MKKSNCNDILLSFVLTIFNPTIKEIKSNLNSFEKILNLTNSKEYNIEFVIINDNPLIDKNILNLIEEYKNNFYFKFIDCDVNGGRVKPLFDNLDKIEGTFIKTLDPDDLLIPEDTVNFIDDILVLADIDSLIIYSYNVVKEFNNFTNVLQDNNEIYFKANSYNPNSVYPTNILKKIKWKFNLLIWSDDLLGYLLIINGAKILEAPEHHFYVNNSHLGISTTKTPHKNPRYLFDSIKFMIISLENISTSQQREMYFSITNKPSIWFFNRICEDIILNKSFSLTEKKYWINFCYELILKFGREIPHLEENKKRHLSFIQNNYSLSKK